MVGILERGQSKSNRIAYIDAAKGIGILLMILGHTGMYGLPVVMHKMIYSFHMPLFAIISGFFLHFSDSKKLLGESLRSKIMKILVPIIS